jgi:adenylate cyclase
MGAWLAPLLLLAAAVFIIAFDPFGIESAVSARLFDSYQRNFPAVYTPTDAPTGGTPVRALELDPQSLAKGGPWPWSEEKLAGLTASLSAAGAKLAVFAIPLETEDGDPADILAKMPPGPDLDAARKALTVLPAPDDILAARFRELKTVVPVTLGMAGGRPPEVKAHFVYHGQFDPYRAAPMFDSGAASTKKLEAAAIGVGARNLIEDSDGVVRRMPLVFRLDGGLIPSLDAEALRVLENRTAITVVTDERDPVTFVRGVGIAALETNTGPVPTDHDGTFRIRYTAGAPQRAVPADSLEGPDTGTLRGAVVVIGPPGAQVKTPLGMMSQAVVLAEGLQDLLSRQVLQRPAYARFAEAAWLALFGVGAIMMLSRYGLAWASGLVLAGILLAVYGSWFLYTGRGVLLDAASPGIGLVLVVIGAAMVNVREMRLKRASLRMAFSDSLPRATIEKIARRPSLLKTDGEIRTVTYLVCGVRGLAGVGASFRDDPAGFTSMMQQVLTPLMDQALAHGGTIDRLTADGFAAFWNAPLADPDHAAHACEAASGMSVMSSRVSEALVQQHHGEGPAPAAVEIGVGVATGGVIAGGFGVHGRMGYSVHGDPVTLAGRIQALSPQYGPAVIVAEDTRQLADRSFAFLEVDYIAAGADDKPVRLYAMLGNPVVRASPKFRALATFHDHIFQALRQQRWAEARDLIEQCRKLSGASQKLYDLHLKRIDYFEANPPGPGWDGAFRPILK